MKLSKKVQEQLDKAKTPGQISKVLSKNESKIAGKREYLQCDEMADLMSEALIKKNIAHKVVVGHSDEGSSHAWVIVGKDFYDPTNQGYGDRSYEVVSTYYPIKPEIIWPEHQKALVDFLFPAKNPADLTTPLLLGTASGIASGLTVLGIERAMKENPNEEICMLYRKIKKKYPNLDYETFVEAYGIAIQEQKKPKYVVKKADIIPTRGGGYVAVPQQNPPQSHERYETFHGVPVDKTFKANIPDPVGELTPIAEIDEAVYICKGKESVDDEGIDTEYTHTWEKNKMILVQDEDKNYFIAGKCRVIWNGINDYKGRPTWDMDKCKLPKIPKKVTYLGILPEIRAGGKLYKFQDTILCTDGKGQYLYITELRKARPTHPTFQ